MKGLKTTKSVSSPDRAAMQKLGKSQRSLADYAKLTPVTTIAPPTLAVNLLRGRK